MDTDPVPSPDDFAVRNEAGTGVTFTHLPSASSLLMDNYDGDDGSDPPNGWITTRHSCGRGAGTSATLKMRIKNWLNFSGIELSVFS